MLFANGIGLKLKRPFALLIVLKIGNHRIERKNQNRMDDESSDDSDFEHEEGNRIDGNDGNAPVMEAKKREFAEKIQGIR